MSLDNILAVGGAAHGELWLLLFGLALSMPLITVGSGVVAWALDRLPWLVFVGSGVLAWTAGGMMVEDPYFHSFLGEVSSLDLILPALLTLAVLAVGWLLRRRQPLPRRLSSHCIPFPSPPSPLLATSPWTLSRRYRSVWSSSWWWPTASSSRPSSRSWRCAARGWSSSRPRGTRRRGRRRTGQPPRRLHRRVPARHHDGLARARLARRAGPGPPDRAAARAAVGGSRRRPPTASRSPSPSP